jgi:hypothetical protein
MISLFQEIYPSVLEIGNEQYTQYCSELKVLIELILMTITTFIKNNSNFICSEQLNFAQREIGLLLKYIYLIINKSFPNLAINSAYVKFEPKNRVLTCKYEKDFNCSNKLTTSDHTFKDDWICEICKQFSTLEMQIKYNNLNLGKSKITW